MYDKPHTIERNLAMLAAAPARIANFTKGLSPVQLVTSPEPGEWLARDVLAHLRACSDMWGKYIVKILNEDHPKKLDEDPFFKTAFEALTPGR